MAPPLIASLAAGVLLGVPILGFGVDGTLAMTIFALAAVLLSGLAGVLDHRLTGLVTGAVAAMLLVTVVIGVKAILWPHAPLVGDGFWILFLGYGGVGLLGAVAGRMLRARWSRPAERGHSRGA